MNAHPRGEPERPATWSMGFAVTLMVGLLVIGFGVRTLWADPSETNPWLTLRVVLGYGIGHDAIIGPICLAVGLVVSRIFRRQPWLRGPLTACLAIVSMLSAISFAAVRRYGERPGNPSALPFDYRRNLLIVSFVVAVVCAACAMWQRSAARKQQSEN